MLQLGASTNKGPIAIIGINDDNLVRLQAGMPLEIDLKALTPPGKRLVKAYIHFAHTYEDVLKDIDEGGLGVNEEMYENARKLDKTAEKSRKKE
jgi:hypothetical protein